MNNTNVNTLSDSATHILQAERILSEQQTARLFNWGLREFGEVLAMQEHLRQLRRTDLIPDTWLAGEHPTVITQGVRGTPGDLIANPSNIPVFKIDRGGQTTLHNPGQLVIYPILRAKPGLLAQGRASRLLLSSVRIWLGELTGLPLDAPKGRPGLFFENLKIAAIGLSIHGGVSMHGIAINCSNDLSPWRAIVPCGEPDTRPQTLSALLGRELLPAELIAALPQLLTRYWGYRETIWLVDLEPQEINSPAPLPR